MTERDGELWGCGRSFAPDLMAFGRSNDAISWTMVTRFDLFCAPVACPFGTIQKDVCDDLKWTTLAEQYSIDGSGCPLVPDVEPPPGREPCCGTADPGPSAVLVVLVALGIRKRRVNPIR